jgi:membrane protein implicated in regulation of membrane protease activity
MPGWAKAIGMVAGSLTALALGGALALRIAAPALGGLVDVLDMLWKVALVLAVILFGAAVVVRSLFAKAAAHAGGDTGSGTDSGQTVIFAPQIDSGGNRLIGRGGDVNIQWGDGNRNKQ